MTLQDTTTLESETAPVDLHLEIAKDVPREDCKLLASSAQIAGETAAGDDIAFSHSVLCQVGLPRSSVDGEEFMRKSGNVWVSVQSGFLDMPGKGAVRQPIPYGVIPRLGLAWVSTYALRNRTQEIPIGSTASEFLRLMGMDNQGARHNMLRKQMHALAVCRIQLGRNGRTVNGQPVERFDTWVTDEEGKQHRLWPGMMRLSDSYYNSLQESAVPLDNRALTALKGSALALDTYCFLAHRLHRIPDGGLLLRWKSLREQFGQEYQGKNPDQDFKKTFIPALKKVEAVYPSAKIRQVMGGVLLMPSPPPVAYSKGQ